MIKKLMMAAMAAAMSFGAKAATETIGGTEWQYTIDNGEATIIQMINWGKRTTIDIPSLPLENLKIAFPPKPACVFRLRAS